jgi:2'-5' RNA ligase
VHSICEGANGLRISPFEITFDRTASFRGRPGSCPFVLIGGEGLDRLKAFRRALSAELARKGLKQRAGTSFEPHVTLLYDGHSVDEYPLGEPISWTIDEIVLIRSRHGHMHVAKWPLRA